MIFDMEKKAKMSKLCSKTQCHGPLSISAERSVHSPPTQPQFSGHQHQARSSGQQEEAAGGRTDSSCASTSHLQPELLQELPSSVWSPSKTPVFKEPSFSIFPLPPHSWLAVGPAMLERVFLHCGSLFLLSLWDFTVLLFTDYLLLFFACYSFAC